MMAGGGGRAGQTLTALNNFLPHYHDERKCPWRHTIQYNTFQTEFHTDSFGDWLSLIYLNF